MLSPAGLTGTLGQLCTSAFLPFPGGSTGSVLVGRMQSPADPSPALLSQQAGCSTSLLFFSDDRDYQDNSKVYDFREKPLYQDDPGLQVQMALLLLIFKSTFVPDEMTSI